MNPTKTQAALLKLLGHETIAGLIAEVRRHRAGNTLHAHVLDRAADLITQIGLAESNIHDHLRSMTAACDAINARLVNGETVYAPTPVVSYATEINASAARILAMSEELRRIVFWVRTAA